MVLRRRRVDGWPSSEVSGGPKYIADEELRGGVNVAVALERPLLVRGEPGTGKTLLARDRQPLGMPLIHWHVKSTTQGRRTGSTSTTPSQRLNDSRFGDATCATSGSTSGSGRSARRSRPSSARRAADRRDRQGRHRVPERSAARARRDGVRTSPRPTRRCARRSGRSSSSRRTTRRSCPTRSCAAACSTTSSSPTAS